MKSYVTEGTGSQQTLRNSQDNKIPIYDSLADVTADLANLSVGQIVATKDTGDELSHPVNVVEEGNLHAVSSNAVANAIPRHIIRTVSVPFWSDYSYRLYPSDLGLTTFENVIVTINATSWNQVADIQTMDNNHITLRIWTISGTSNATVEIQNSGNVSILVQVIQFI